MATKIAVQQTTSGQTIGPGTTYNADGSISSYGGGGSSGGGSSSGSSGSGKPSFQGGVQGGIDYTFNVGSETIPEYNARIAAAQGARDASNTPYVADSSAIVASENDTTNNLNTLMGQTPDIKLLMENSKNSIAEIEAYAQKLQAQYDSNEYGIKSAYEFAKNDTKEAQAKESGATNTAITTKLGGYLGSSGSAVGVMNNLAASHRTELLKLDAQRDAALQAARDALMTKQFELARLKSEEIKSLSSEIYQRQQDFFNNALKLSAENRQQDEAMRTRVKDTLEMLAMAGPDAEIDINKEREIDSFYGVKGFTRNYLAAASAAAEAESQQQKFDTMQKYVNLIESVPKGMEIPFGDEVLVGIGSTSDIATFQTTDDNGNVRIISYNKGDGSYTSANMGTIGKSDSSSGVTPGKALSKYQEYLVPGQTLPDGTPILNPDGNIQPKAWGYLISDARTRSIPRADFIKAYGYLVGDPTDKQYGLTQVEQSLITSY